MKKILGFCPDCAERAEEICELSMDFSDWIEVYWDLRVDCTDQEAA